MGTAAPPRFESRDCRTSVRMNLARATNGPYGHGMFTLGVEGPCPSHVKGNRAANRAQMSKRL